jgi:hypothetical protein
MRRAALFFAVWLASSTAAAGDGRPEAQEHFMLGVEHVKEKRWEPALAEFQRSYDALPTRAARKNIAVCLRELGRFDEALDAYAGLLRDFGRDLSRAERDAIDADVAQLRRFLGELVVSSDPPGAAVFVDGRERGTTPLAAPIPVAVGTRAVRVAKEGFLAYETRVVVSSGDRSVVAPNLVVVTERGVLRVTEPSGEVADVRVDSAVVGRTPWEGKVSAGDHVVTLRGQGDVGAAPRSVTVATGRTTEVSIAVGVLPGELRVEPTPPSARVLVDGRPVSTGTFSGMVPSGERTVDVEAGWYEPHHAVVTVSSAAPEVVRVSLVPVPRVWLDVMGGGAVLVPLDGAKSVLDCAGGCIGVLGGGRAGYRVARWVSLEVFFDTMGVSRTSADVTASVGLDFGGVSASCQLFDRIPLTFRLSLGAGHGVSGGQTFWTPVGGPEARIGYRFTRALGVDVGVGATFLLFPQVGGVAAPGVFFPATVALHAGL